MTTLTAAPIPLPQATVGTGDLVVGLVAVLNVIVVAGVMLFTANRSARVRPTLVKPEGKEYRKAA